MINRKIAVVGLGYVGLPVAVAFGRSHPVVGFDIKAARISELRSGHDATGEVTSEELAAADIRFSSDVNALRECDFFIVAVPTPVDSGNKPDLYPLLAASASVGKALKRGDIVVYESTVYPGATEEDCIPVLERESGLRFGVDFGVGYSPERINPGDREHTFTKIKKIVSGSDAQTLDVVADVYASVVTAGVHRASCIKVAEAAKVIENTQRDLNIALMNELAVVFKRMDIDTQEVLDAAGSKWNFLPFRPGLVGGHCIGVDPYYLTHKAEQLGYIPQVILAGRRINDNMGRYVAAQTIKQMLRQGVDVARSRVGVLGITFKENCPDTRNSKVVDIVRELRSYGVEVVVADPHADPAEVHEEYGLALGRIDASEPVDALIVAVAHREYRALTPAQLRACVRQERPVLVDVKSLYPRQELQDQGFSVWRL
ncbi:nucleotide sugar dehydrogenase [Ramlibacter rhizophilus]|uniref:Nucleotide sugar dehydrogenase n=1 Tax=Ramlibacter rhizophilus TaxID=1781167 RepID=A0A4Z0BLI8_9BURK|nr:nucleotide sugar dehydrogenase [Ramlibacter rhizophilus]TFY99660.1 nucleotide sugar dehydrogenase [Ramlibacter rhizophilus]